MGLNLKISKNLLDPASRVSSLKTGVTFKVDHLGLTSSGYPSGTYFKDIQNLLEPASRVSYLRIGVTSKVDRLGLTPLGYPNETHFGDTPKLGRSLNNYSIVALCRDC